VAYIWQFDLIGTAECAIFTTYLVNIQYFSYSVLGAVGTWLGSVTILVCSQLLSSTQPAILCG